MRKTLVIPLFLIMLLGIITPGVLADDTQVDVYEQGDLVKSVVFVIGENEYFINNQTPGVEMDAEPFIETGRTFVPIRYLSNALGVEDKHIDWEKPKVTLSQPDMPVVELSVGKKEITSDNQAKQIDVAPLLRDGRTYLPARFVAEALGYQVAWDGENDIVLCWPRGEEEPDVSEVVDYLGGEVDQERSEPGGNTYTENGYTIPEDTGNLYVNAGNTGEDNSYSELDLQILTYEEDVEEQFKYARQILESKFDNEDVDDMLEYARQKKERFDTLDKDFNVDGYETRVSAAGEPLINIQVWRK